MVRKTCWWDVPPEHAYKHRVLLISKGPYCSYKMQQETMRGSLFPLFPLRVKCQNHERVPISPILVATSCQDMDHQNKGNRDPLSVFPWWSAKTMRGSIFPLFPLRVKCQNHQRAPISPILVATSCQDMDHQNRGNRGPLNVFPWWSAKSMRGSLFPLFPLRVKCQNHERVPIFSISPIFRAYLFILPRHGPPK